jgi:predicted nucleotide-binding protein
VFLAYSSASAVTAAQIKALVENSGASVLDWKSDFVAGPTILSSIKDAADTCSCGIFVFGEDDSIASGDHLMAPRDNVVFEAGYFMHARGHKSCLIIRRGATRMPADVGGIIYLPLPRDADASTIAPQLTQFLTENLTRNSPDDLS